jgi:hypothetical protein
MSKIYLDVEVPGNAKSYEFVADDALPVGRVKKEFIEQICAVEMRKVFADPSDVLFSSRQLEGMLQDNEILGEVGVKSGDTIILI